MAKKFQIRRGLRETMPVLEQGELAMTIDAGSEGVHIGTGEANIELAKKSDVEDLLGDLTSALDSVNGEVV